MFSARIRPSRRLLLLPAAALVLLGGPVFAAEDPAPPPATTTVVPVVGAATVQAGWSSNVTPVDATLVGVTWKGDPSASFKVEVRGDDGKWSSTSTLDGGTEADSGTKDAERIASRPVHGSEPVWIGNDASAVRVKLADGSASDVSVAAVDAQPNGVPSGSAGALGSFVPQLGGPGRYAFAGMLVALALLLVALAAGWSPWRSRRKLFLALALGAILLSACRPAPPAPRVVPNGDVMPGMITRAQWGARPFACGTPDYAPSLKFAIVHHTVNSNNYSANDSAALVRGIQAYHLDALGYCDIAYNFLVDRFGQIFEGRAGGATLPVIGGHTGGFNTASTGVALIGTFTSVSPPPAMWDATVHLLRWRLSIAGINANAPFTTTAASSPCNCVRWGPGTVITLPVSVIGHRDVDFTECPGNTFWPQLAALRDQVQAGIVPPSTTTTTSTTLATHSVTAASAPTSSTTTTAPTTTTTTTAPHP